MTNESHKVNFISHSDVGHYVIAGSRGFQGLFLLKYMMFSTLSYDQYCSNVPISSAVDFLEL